LSRECAGVYDVRMHTHDPNAHAKGVNDTDPIKATSVSIHTYEGYTRFRFWEDTWGENGELIAESEVTCIDVPRTMHNEVAIYTGDTNEAYDYTDWMVERAALPEGHETLLHRNKA